MARRPPWRASCGARCREATPRRRACAARSSTSTSPGPQTTRSWPLETASRGGTFSGSVPRRSARSRATRNASSSRSRVRITIPGSNESCRPFARRASADSRSRCAASRKTWCGSREIAPAAVRRSPRSPRQTCTAAGLKKHVPCSNRSCPPMEPSRAQSSRFFAARPVRRTNWRSRPAVQLRTASVRPPRFWLRRRVGRARVSSNRSRRRKSLHNRGPDSHGRSSAPRKRWTRGEMLALERSRLQFSIGQNVAVFSGLPLGPRQRCTPLRWPGTIVSRIGRGLRLRLRGCCEAATR